MAPSRGRVPVRSVAETLGFGAAGAALLLSLHFPAGALVGAMLAVGIASLCGRPTAMPPAVQESMMIIFGLAAGGSITPAIVQGALHWPLSLVSLAVTTAAISWIGYGMFRRFGGCDRVTAFFATAPGGLSAAVILAQAHGADVSRVAIAQVLRVVVLAALAPLVVVSAHGHGVPPAVEGRIGGAMGWVLLVVLVLAGRRLAQQLRWPMPGFLGPVAASGLVHAAGLVELVLPMPLVMAAGGLMGAVIGTRFRGISPRDLLRFFPSAIGSLGVMGLFGMTAGWFTGTLVGVGGAAGMLAFAPGGMDGMIAIALATGTNPAYVTVHHTARLLAVLAFLPILARRRRSAAAAVSPHG